MHMPSDGWIWKKVLSIIIAGRPIKKDYTEYPKKHFKMKNNNISANVDEHTTST